MPDVGVLQLSIKDNSTKAGTGVDKLADALTRVKDAVGVGLGLDKVNTELSEFAKATTKGTNAGRVIKELTDLGKAIEKINQFKNIFNAKTFKFDVTPLKKLKDAIGDGISIVGNPAAKISAISDALNSFGDYTTAIQGMRELKSRADAFKNGDTATVLSTMAKGINDYAKALKNLQSVADAKATVGKDTQGVGSNVAEGIKEGINNQKDKPLEATKDMVRALITVAQSILEEHSPSRVFKRIGEYTIEGASQGIESKRGRLISAMSSVVNSAVQSARSLFMKGFGESFVGMNPMIQGFNTQLETTISKMAQLDTVASHIRMPDFGNMPTEIIPPDNSPTEPIMLDFSDAKTELIMPDFSNDPTEVITLDFSDSKTELIGPDFSHIDTEPLIPDFNSMMKNDDWFYDFPEDNPITEIIEEFNTTVPDTVTGLNQLKTESMETGTAFQDFGNMVTETITELETIGEQTQIATTPLDMATEKITEVADTFSTATEPMQAYADGMTVVSESIQAMESSFASTEPYTQMTQTVQDTSTAFENTKTEMNETKNSADNLEEGLRNVDKELKSKKRDAGGASIAFRNFGRAISETFPVLSMLWYRLKNILLRRTITAAIRAVTGGIKEGVQNLYEYSKLVGTGFAPAMDSAATSLQQMKNSIAAALAPAIQALIPVLQTVVNWFINLINYVNQFLSLLRGQSTWTRALPAAATAFDNQTRSARNASKAMKDLLADWDELNIIQNKNNNNGGGGGSSNNQDYGSMFEEVDRYDSKIRNLVQFIKDNFEKIKEYALAVLSIIAAWKIGNMLSSLTGIAGLGFGLGVMTLGVQLSFIGGKMIGKGELTKESIIDSVAGVLASALGGMWLGKSIATAIFGAGAAGAGVLVGGLAGLAIGLSVLVYAIHVGKTNTLYGDVEKSRDDISKEVQGFFNLPVNVELDATIQRIQEIETAEANVKKALEELNTDFQVNITAELTNDEASKFHESIKVLVNATNALISKNQEHIKIGASVMIDGKETSDVVTFSDNAWKLISEYINEKGAEIGKLLTDGVTIDEAQVINELRGKLAKISEALLEGEQSANFASKMALSGASLRNGSYTKETVETYMDVYTERANEVKQAAEANAIATKESLGKLARAMEAAGEEAGFTAEDIKQAWDNYTNYDVTAKAKEFYEKWSTEGNKIFIDDMTAGLQGLLSQESPTNQLKIAFDRVFEGIKTSGSSYNLEVNMLQYIADAIGIDKNKLSAMLDAMGKNVFDILPEELRAKLQESVLGAMNERDNIVKIPENWMKLLFPEKLAEIEANGGQRNISKEITEYLMNKDVGKIDDTLLRNIAGQYDISLREMINSLDYSQLDKDKIKRIREVVEAYNKLFTLHNRVDDYDNSAEIVLPKSFIEAEDGIVEEIRHKIADSLAGQKFTSYSEWDTFVTDLINQFYGEYDKDLVARAFEGIEPTIEVPVGIIPKISNETEVLTQFRETIEEMLRNDAILDASEKNELLTTFGQTAYQSMLKQLGISFDSDGQHVSINGVPVTPETMNTPEMFIGSDGVNGNGESDEDEMALAVEKGVSSGNEKRDGWLSSLVDIVQRLERKQWVVNVNPSTDWGEHNDRSNYYYGRMTGYQP